MSQPQKDVLLILMPYIPIEEFRETLDTVSPGIKVVPIGNKVYDKTLPEDVDKELLKSATAILSWNIFPTREQAPNLKYVQLTSAGCNQVQGLPLFEDHDEVNFCTANGTHGPQIAEWVFSTFLAHQHRLPAYLDDQKIGQWTMPESDVDTEDAVGLRAGILGYGSIGRQCARVARAFGMDVHAYTLHERPTPESRRDEAFCEPGLGDPEGAFPSRWFHGADQVDEFLAGLDLLVITLPLTAKTEGLIGARQFHAMSARRAFVSNIGRGAIIRTDDLVAALNEGLIRGAALDVTEPEPLPRDHPLWKAKNVIITPHVSGNSNHYSQRLLKIMKANFERMRDGKPLINKIDKGLGY